MSRQRPTDWDTRRKKVYRRDDFECQNCGRKGGPRGNAELHAHHIVPVASGGSHNLSNLKTVCLDCHKAIHGNTLAPTATRYGTNTEGRARESSDRKRRRMNRWAKNLPERKCPVCGVRGSLNTEIVGTETRIFGLFIERTQRAICTECDHTAEEWSYRRLNIGSSTND